MCGYVACVPECRGSVCFASQLSNSGGSKKLPDDGKLWPKHVGISIRIRSGTNQCIVLVISTTFNNARYEY
jgi:hypothetical protein